MDAPHCETCGGPCQMTAPAPEKPDAEQSASEFNLEWEQRRELDRFDERDTEASDA